MSPRFSLLMPFLNETASLPRVLESIAGQAFPHEQLNLIAVDNGSDDGSAEFVRAWLAANDIAGEVVRDDVRSIPRALNRALSRARADDVIVRIDAHTVYGPRYVSAIAEAFATLGTGVWCVGASQVPLPEREFGLALHVALFYNPIGFGQSDRLTETTREVNQVYLGAWRPGVLQRLGGYDERWLANEDCELAERLRAAGGRIMRIPLESGYIVTRGPVSTIRQWNRYGFWRAQTVKRYPQSLRPRHVVPPLALAGGLLLLATPARRVLPFLALAYAAAVVIAGKRDQPLSVTAASVAFFPAVQTAYALGLMRGFLRTPPARSGEADAFRPSRRNGSST